MSRSPASISIAGFNNLRTRANDYQQDRNAMKLGDFTGITGIPNQDIAMWETMGPIADRTRERLGASDLAVVEFRRIMVEAARAMRAWRACAIGRTQPHIPHAADPLVRRRRSEIDELAHARRGRQARSQRQGGLMPEDRVA